MSPSEIRFEVTFETFKGEKDTYTAVSLFGAEKALSMCTHAHLKKHPKKQIFKVHQKLLQYSDSPEGTDLVDRYEW